ncbi:MBG domain-containing protein [[Clostridium] innocuum]|nr:MBG domain-containing protein [[Clostridium] innocuum]
MMSNKKKQTAVVAVATVLSVSTMMNPIVINAQDVVHEESSQSYERKEAPEIIPPQDLKAKAGTPLKEIKLPDNWAWADESTVLSIDTTTYPAYVMVDDETYDYVKVEGYNAEGHYVGVKLSVTVETLKEEPAPAPILKSPLSRGAIPTPYALDDVEINETNFPDAAFRKYLKADTGINPDNNDTLSAAEIARVTFINVSNKADISDLTGIDKFLNLSTLYCYKTSITSLDVSKNAKLTALWCYSNKELKTLNVDGASALTDLQCGTTAITSLDVSSNAKLTTLDCRNAVITSLDVSNSPALKILKCSDNPLAYLNIGTKVGLTTVMLPTSTTMDLEITEDTFNITDKITGIDKSKVSIKSGASYESATGVISDYTTGTPIVYEYDCGTANGAKKTLTVTMNLTGYGDVEINETNFPDAAFRKYLKENTGINPDNNDTLSAAEIARVTFINVSNKADISDLTGIDKFLNLSTLYCYKTSITSLDVSKNAKLTALWCYSNKELKTLNVDGASALTDLQCGTTAITSLDVSSNAKLTTLDCRNAVITSLDVSNSPALKILKCSDNPLAYLNIGTKVGLTTVMLPTSTTMELEITEDTFNITDKITGIDKSKVSIKSGADYDSTTGVISDYTAGMPIVYEYDCGTANGIKKTLTVTMNLTGLKSESTISVTAILDKTYDGTAVNNAPAVNKSGSTGAVTYAWEKKKNVTEWESIAVAPTDAGTYRVTATVAADDNYNKASSVAKEFIISKANSSISVTANLDKVYNGSAVSSTPTIEKSGSTGVVTYAWEKKNNRGDWERITAAPINAGIYRVTATVVADDNYKSAAATKEFTISQAEPSYTVPKDLQGVYGQSLKDITLPNGFAWTDQTLDVGNAGINEFTLTYTPEDDNYKTVTDIKVTVTVTKAKNEQAAPISLEGWTYGAAPSAVRAGFRFGQPRFLYSDRMAGTYTDTVPTAAGTWYVKAVVDGTDNYEGAESEVVSFVIEPKSAETDNQIKVPEMSTDTRLDDLVIKDGDKVLVQGTDYDVTKTQDGNKVVVTITFKGNYTGTVVQAYTSGKKDKDMQMDSSDTQKEAGKNESDKKDTLNNANLETVPTGDTTAKGIWTMFMLFAAGVGAFMRKRFVKK